MKLIGADTTLIFFWRILFCKKRPLAWGFRNCRKSLLGSGANTHSMPFGSIVGKGLRNMVTNRKLSGPSSNMDKF
jgi:hypothetical protein